VSDGVYGSDVFERSYWGGGDYSTWLDYSNSLPPGLLQRYYVYAQPAQHTDNVGTGVARIQIWRQSRPPSPVSARRAFQLVWQARVLLLPCDALRGALHTVTDSKLVAWHSGRTSVSGRRTFPVLRSTCS